jgi:hypothetical protein
MGFKNLSQQYATSTHYAVVVVVVEEVVVVVVVGNTPPPPSEIASSINWCHFRSIGCKP